MEQIVEVHVVYALRTGNVEIGGASVFRGSGIRGCRKDVGVRVGKKEKEVSVYGHRSKQPRGPAPPPDSGT